MSFKENLPTKEDLQAFFGIAAITILMPVAIVIAIVGLLFAWTLLLTILVIIGTFVAIVALMVLYGYLKMLMDDWKEKRGANS